MLRRSPEVKRLHQQWKDRHGPKQALAMLAHKIGRAVYYILKRQQPFNLDMFLQTA
jgi:hypothetical protein